MLGVLEIEEEHSQLLRREERDSVLGLLEQGDTWALAYAYQEVLENDSCRRQQRKKTKTEGNPSPGFWEAG